MKYIVTGAAGFIGSNLVDFLLDKGCSVIGIDNFESGRIENVQHLLKDVHIQDIKSVIGTSTNICVREEKNNFCMYKADIKRPGMWMYAIEEGDIIFHLAAIPSVIESIENPRKSFDTNIDGTLKLLQIAEERKAKRIIFSSSAAVYGKINKPPMMELYNVNSLSQYAVSKVAGEQLMSAYAEISNLETVNLRYFNIFGPRQNPHSQYASAIPKFIKAFLYDEEITIFGDGSQTRDFTYVDNVVQANWLAANSKHLFAGDIFNICSGQKHTVNDLIEVLSELFNEVAKIKYADFRQGEIKHSYGDIRKAQKFLNFDPGVNFKDGLLKTINYIKNEERK